MPALLVRMVAEPVIESRRQSLGTSSSGQDTILRCAVKRKADPLDHGLEVLIFRFSSSHFGRVGPTDSGHTLSQRRLERRVSFEQLDGAVRALAVPGVIGRYVAVYYRGHSLDGVPQCLSSILPGR